MTCRRHEWAVRPGGTTTCLRCNKVRDEVTSRRGKSSSRMGKDQERRAEKVYGWEKIGERGEKVDLLGRTVVVQQKSTRKAPPALFRDAFAGLATAASGKTPLLLLSYVRQGVPVEDYIVMRGSDFLDLHGRLT